MLGSNQRPLPCEVSTIVCWRFLEFAKSLQISILTICCFSSVFRIFTRVAARLLHIEFVELRSVILTPIARLAVRV